jgi:hypothetical protein
MYMMRCNISAENETNRMIVDVILFFNVLNLQTPDIITTRTQETTTHTKYLNMKPKLSTPGGNMSTET